MLDEFIFRFRGFWSIFSLLFYFLMENPVTHYVASDPGQSGSALFLYEPFTNLLKL